jgi:hypothetical protein
MQERLLWLMQKEEDGALGEGPEEAINLMSSVDLKLIQDMDISEEEAKVRRTFLKAVAMDPCPWSCTRALYQKINYTAEEPVPSNLPVAQWLEWDAQCMGEPDFPSIAANYGIPLTREERVAYVEQQFETLARRYKNKDTLLPQLHQEILTLSSQLQSPRMRFGWHLIAVNTLSHYSKEFATSEILEIHEAVADLLGQELSSPEVFLGLSRQVPLSAFCHYTTIQGRAVQTVKRREIQRDRFVTASVHLELERPLEEATKDLRSQLRDIFRELRFALLSDVMAREVIEIDTAESFTDVMHYHHKGLLWQHPRSDSAYLRWAVPSAVERYSVQELYAYPDGYYYFPEAPYVVETLHEIEVHLYDNCIGLELEVNLHYHHEGPLYWLSPQ